jgi:hypothetical protein
MSAIPQGKRAFLPARRRFNHGYTRMHTDIGIERNKKTDKFHFAVK